MNLPIALPWKHAEWNSIDGGLLPVLVGIMRLCWIWPWMLLIQGFLSPSVAAPLMPPWMLVALPVLSFSLARWSMPTFSERRDLRRVTEVRRQIAGGRPCRHPFYALVALPAAGFSSVGSALAAGSRL